MLRILLLLSFFLSLLNCSAQSWDWIIGSTNNYYGGTNIRMNESGESIIFDNKEIILKSTTDSVYYSGEELTRFDANGKRICGLKLGINNLYSGVSAVTEQGNNVFIILSIQESITIDGKYYQSNNKNYNNLILIITDRQFKIKSSQLLGNSLNRLFYIKSIIVDTNENFYLSGNFNILNLKSAGNTPVNYAVKEQAAFVAKFSFAGELKWLNYYGGVAGYSFCSDLFFDSKKNLRFFVDNPGSTIYHLNSLDGKEVSLKFSIFGDTRLRSIYTDKNDKIYLVGMYKGISLQDGSFSASSKEYGPFLLVFSPDYKLELKLSESLNLNSYLFLNTVVTDTLGRIYISGHSSFPKGDTVSIAGYNLSPDPLQNQFYIRLDKNAKGKWIDHAKNSFQTWSFSVNSYRDSCNNIYFAGLSQNGGINTPYNHFSLGSHTIVSGKKHGVYLAKLNPDKLEFRLEEKCDGYYLINESDTSKYNSFMWTLPGGETQKSTHALLPKKFYKDSVYVSLTGYKPGGCQNTITKKLKPLFLPVPKVSFTTDSFAGCQWVGKKFYADISSAGVLDSSERLVWDFGDGDSSNIKNPVHIYKKSGQYKVKLWYSNGYCSDSFISQQTITIIDAPKPGFSASVTKGCTPLKVELKDKSDGAVVKYFYDFGNGETDTIPSPTVIYNQPGIYKIKQELLGTTGCITSDSVFINVIQGISPQQSPQLKFASVTAKNNVEIVWQPLFAAEKYFIYRKNASANADFTLITETNATSFADTLINPSEASFIYKIIAKDSCGNLSNESNIGKTILLKAKNENNKFALLQWTPYEDWQQNGGVASYTIEAIDSTDNFTEIAKLNSNTSYYDENFWHKENKERCYRIRAVSVKNNQIKSFSNNICLPYLPQLWIPTAFSPNGDGLNDTFKVVSTGITDIDLQIFNRWGENIFTINNKNESWDGKYNGEKLPPGEYLYIIKAKGTDHQKIYTSGSLQLLR